MIRRASGMLALVAALVLTGCASEVARSGVAFQPSLATPRQTLEVSSPVTLTLSTGYQRSILAGSRWEHVGFVPQGDVYRPVGNVLTIEGANMHEAFLVLRDGRVVGFYLPGERAYSALDPATRITYKTVN
jgi:hypothetical protein